ncbi:MAG: hypothetical protein AB7P52_01460 [Alphaproteobacteria bacterium]
MRRRFAAALVAAVIAFGVAGAQADHEAGSAGSGFVPADIGPPEPPQGMAEIGRAGTGRVFQTWFGGSNSATKLMQAFVTGVADYFDAPPRVEAAMRDGADRRAEAAFSAGLGRVPVRGVLTVMAQGEGGQGIMIIDYADRLAQSYDALNAPQGGGAGPAPTPPLQQVRIPDGSGTIGLAPGWRIRNAYDGAVDIDGPGGAYFGLAGRSLLTTEPYAQMFPQMPYVSSLDPVQGLYEVAAQSQRLGGLPTQVEVLGAEPVPWQNGQAALIRFRLATPQQVLDNYGLYALMQTDAAQVMSYYTAITAPPEVFEQILPAALAMWSSWSANPGFLTERLRRAAETLRSSNDTIAGGNAGATRGGENANAAWSQYLRGTTTLETEEGGVRVREEVDRDFGRYWAREFPQDYREVPLNELVVR